MDLNIIRIISYIKLFIVLMYFLENTSSLLCTEKPDMSVLKSICIIRDNPKDMGGLPENQCTAIGLYGDPNNRFNSVSADFGDIEKLRNDLPFVYVDNNKQHHDILRDIRPQNLDNFVKERNEFIQKHGINVMIFDNLYKKRDIQKYNQQLDRNADHIRIHGLFRALKIHIPYVLFGMMISYNDENLDDINLEYYDTVIDFFAFDTVFINYCSYDIKTTTTVDELNKTLVQMESNGFNMHKSILTIDLHVTDMCPKIKKKVNGCNIRSYENICSHDKSDLHSCQDTLESYYQKGLLVNTYNMSGAIIQSASDDDFSSRCCCGPFPGITVIDAGIRGSPEPNDITNCKKWGLYHKSC